MTSLAIALAIPLSSHRHFSYQDEICDNAIDDDNDGLIDLNDNDCVCRLVETVSLIPNSSFEETNCCPQMQSQLSCATGWDQASFPTTDFINTCGWLGWNNDVDKFPPPQPFPDGQGIVGFRNGVYFPASNSPTSMEVIRPNWKEYAGACLISPMQADSVYRIEFDIGFVNSRVSPPIAITLYGSTSCENLPFGAGEGDTLTGCPTNAPGWIELGNARVLGGENVWVKDSITVLHDEDIYAIAIGPDCLNSLKDVNRYYFLDNLVLDKASTFETKISTISNPCADDFALLVENNPELSYQWYKDGVAIVGETSHSLSQLYGEGDYQLRSMDDSQCVLTGVYTYSVPILYNSITQSICHGDGFQFDGQILTESGQYVDTIKSDNTCDTVVLLELEIENELIDTINAKIFEGETFDIGGKRLGREGEHVVTLISPDGCEIETIVRVDFHEIFIPNIFSPNLDGNNDDFTISAAEGIIQNVEMNIFDRWGNRIFKGSQWDGRSNGEIVLPGVYAYAINVIVNDGTSHLFSGTVTVLY